MPMAMEGAYTSGSATLHAIAENYFQFEQIYLISYTNTFAIWTNTICNLDKYEAVANGHGGSIDTSGSPTLRTIAKI